MNTKIAGAIIAGGKSGRFGNINKARAMLGGKTLLEHVHDRLQPQVSALYINCQPDFIAASQVNSPLIAEDYLPNKKGPLNGVLGALSKTIENGFEWMLIAPCDTPFLPLNLASVLMNAATERNLELVIPAYKGIPQASLSLWHRNLLEPLRKSVVDHGAEGFKQFYPHTLYELLEWPQADHNPFLNINHQGDLSEATEVFNRLRNQGPG